MIVNKFVYYKELLVLVNGATLYQHKQMNNELGVSRILYQTDSLIDNRNKKEAAIKCFNINTFLI